MTSRTSTRLIMLSASLWVGLLACGRPETPVTTDEQSSPPVVQTTTLKPERWRETVRAYGVIEAAETVNLTTDFHGTVMTVRFEEGGAVSVGDTLIEFDSRKRTLRLSQSEKVQEETKARLDRALSVSERREALYQKRAISLEELENARTATRSAKALYEEAMAARRLAQKELQEAVLVSPVTGLIAARDVEPGEAVLPGQLLGVVQVVDTVRAATFVSEKDVNGLAIGGEARVETPGVRGREYPARIASIGVRADPLTGNFPVKLAVTNEDGLLRDGMTARIELVGLEHPEMLLLPAAALADRNRRRVVFTVVDGHAVAVEPVLAASTLPMIPVLEGLEPGDTVITEGVDSVAEGTPVRMVPVENPQ